MRARYLVILVGLALPGVAYGQDFTAQISPNPVLLTAGGAADDVTVTTNPDPTLSGPITYSFSGLPAGITTGGPQTVGAPYPPVTFSFAAGSGVTVGSYSGSLVGNVSGRMASFPVTVRVQAPDFSLAAMPVSVSLLPGATRMVTVSAIGIGGSSGTVSVSSSAPQMLDVQPAAFDMATGEMRTVSVTADAAAAPGPQAVVFSGSLPGAGTRTATVSVTVEALPDPPIIQSVAPATVATGTRDNVVLLAGLNFQAGATITAVSPGVLITSASVLGPGSARIVLDVRPDARAGPVQLTLRNPDGGVAMGGTGLLVVPAGALSAPLAVTAARIVTPRPWQIVEPDRPVRARALLATSGTGTVVGTWLLDGVPFDRFTRVVTSGYPVEVVSAIPIPAAITGERRLTLAIESPESLPSTSVPLLLASASRSEIRLLAQRDAGAAPGEPGATNPASGRREPLVRWSLVPGASGYVVEIRSGGGTEDAMIPAVQRRVTDSWWTPDLPLVEALSDEPVALRVWPVFPGDVLGDPTPWRSVRLGDAEHRDGERLGAVRVRDDGGSPFGVPDVFAGASVPPDRSDDVPWTPPRRPRPGLDSPVYARSGALRSAAEGGELQLALQGTTSATESSLDTPPALTRLQLSGQVDAKGPALDVQGTADLAGSQDLGDPWDAREESRNWLVRAGAAQTGFRETATIGFAPPSFFDQAELLTVTTSGGAFEGTFDTPAGSLSYYRSLDLSGNDAFAAFEPEIDAAAYELSDDSGRWLFRTTLLEATDPGIGDFSVGGRGRGLGAMGVVDLGPRLRLTGEAATGDFSPGEESLDAERDGGAFRVAASGTSGATTYGLTLGHTARGFVNPANPGFTPGGVSDRTRGELTLGRSFGPATVSGSYRHIRGDVAEAAGDPKSTENGGTLVFSMPVTNIVSFNLSANLAEQRGDAVDDIGLPGTDRSQKGVDISVTEALGAVSLTQTVTLQDFTDRVQPIADQRVSGFGVFGHGVATEYLSISTSLAATRIRSAPELGTTDQFLVSLQPTLSIVRLGLGLSPRVAFSRVSNDLFDSESKTDQYQVVARWSPPWLGDLVAMEIAGDWSRNWTDLDPEPPPFDRRIVFSASFTWQTSRAWPGAAP